jgi:hypothetical protein
MESSPFGYLYPTHPSSPCLLFSFLSEPTISNPAFPRTRLVFSRTMSCIYSRSSFAAAILAISILAFVAVESKGLPSCLNEPTCDLNDTEGWDISCVDKDGVCVTHCIPHRVYALHLLASDKVSCSCGNQCPGKESACPVANDECPSDTPYLVHRTGLESCRERCIHERHMDKYLTKGGACGPCQEDEEEGRRDEELSANYI